jgi:hypothetical protein
LQIALGLLLVPLIVAAGVLVRVSSGFHAVGDIALSELHTRDVGRHAVLLGPYSRDGWNHLGPAMYYLLAPLYRVTGSRSSGMYIGALAVNAVALAGMASIAWRRGGLHSLLFTSLGVTLVMHALGPQFLRDPWNPYITVLPFGLLVFLVWELSAGTTWALPVAAAVTTFLVQTHVGYVPVAIPLLIGGALWLALARRRNGTDQRANGIEGWDLVRAGIITATVLVVMWLPPVIGVIRHTPGNLATAVRYFLHPGSQAHGLLDGYRVVAAQLSSSPDWLAGAKAPNPFTGEPSSVFHTVVPWLAIAFLLATWQLWRRRAAEAVRLAAILAGAMVLGSVAVARTIGPLVEYRLRWTWLLGMLAMVVVASAIWNSAWRVKRTSRNSLMLAPVAIGIVALTATNAVSAALTSTPAKPGSVTLTQLVPPLLKALPQRNGVVIVSAPTFAGLVYQSGIVLWLERLGIAVRVPNGANAAQGVGARRVYHGGAVRVVVTVADDASFDTLAADPNQKLVVAVSRGTRSPTERAAIREQLGALEAQYRAGTISAREFFERSRPMAGRLGTALGLFIQIT